MNPAAEQASPGWTAVAPDRDIGENGFLEFTLGDRPCFLFRRNGQLYGYHNRCPHLGITLNWMPAQFMDSDNCFIHCANHGALFTPESGYCIAGPCQGGRLTPLAIRVESGHVEVRILSENHR